MKLMEDYKKEPGGKEKLKEQNSKFINDDYVKFLRYGQHFIEKRKRCVGFYQSSWLSRQSNFQRNALESAKNIR